VGRFTATLVGAWLLALGLGGAAAGQTSDLEAARQESRQAVTQLLLIEDRLAGTQTALASAEAEAGRLSDELAARTAERDRAERDLRTAQERLGSRVREDYKARRVGFLDLLLGSRSFAQLLGRVELVGRLVAQDARLVADVASVRKEAATAATRLDQVRREQGARIVELAGVRDELAGARDEQAALAQRLGDRLAAAQAEARAAAERMAAINQKPESAPAAAHNRGTTGGTSQAGSRPAPTPKPAATGGGSSSPRPGGRQLRVKVTAYCDRGYTASGVPTGPGIIAVDPRLIPLGTRVYVEGYGEALAADTGGDIKGNWIDIWLPDYQQALDFGTQYRTITVYD